MTDTSGPGSFNLSENLFSRPLVWRWVILDSQGKAVKRYLFTSPNWLKQAFGESRKCGQWRIFEASANGRDRLMAMPCFQRGSH